MYRCGDGWANLCRISPDGGGQTVLTTDGRPVAAAYGSPSLSRDGSRFAFNFANQSFVVDADPTRRGAAVASGATIALLRPDAGVLATIETFPEQTMVPGLTGPTFFMTNTPFIITYDLAKPERQMNRRLPATLAWAGDRLVTNDEATPSKKQTLCLLKADRTNCERSLARDDARDLTDPAVSPDGKLLAVVGCFEPRSSTTKCHTR